MISLDDLSFLSIGRDSRTIYFPEVFSVIPFTKSTRLYILLPDLKVYGYLWWQTSQWKVFQWKDLTFLRLVNFSYFCIINHYFKHSKCINPVVLLQLQAVMSGFWSESSESKHIRHLISSSQSKALDLGTSLASLSSNAYSSSFGAFVFPHFKSETRNYILPSLILSNFFNL